MKRRNVLSSPRLSELKKRRKRALVNKLIISLLGVAAIFSLFTYLSRLNSLNISNIQVVGNKVVDEDMIQATVQNGLTGKYLWLFPKSNILYYPKSTLEATLLATYKRIKTVQLSVKTNRTLEVSIVENEAKYTWCGDTLPLLNATSEKCYFMDSTGYIFDEAPYFSGGIYFKFYGNDNVNMPEPLGSYFLKGKFPAVLKLQKTIDAMELKTSAFWLDENGSANFALSRDLANGPKIIFALDSDFEKIAENLQAALSTEPLKSKIKNNLLSLLYIDLRFGNKVYDKFK